ncbi:MAG TPA: hypothetical protein VFB96_05240 [Pirellulaceae bacterium]|jgi:hypothetical protein|nr:hypothetical protein [Pirellulaceae bacterium]
MDIPRFDPLHQCIAFGPLVVYLLILGMINLGRRPFLTTGARDTAVLGIAISGFIAAGPMELFLPEGAANLFGGWIWALLLTFYLLCLLLVVLLMRPRLVIYNVTFEQLRPALADVVSRLDDHARWAGESLSMPTLGLQLTVEPMAVMKSVQLVSAGPYQNIAGWRRLEEELAAELKQSRGLPNPYGVFLLSFALCLGGAVLFWMSRDPAGVTQALNDMLRR